MHIVYATNGLPHQGNNGVPMLGWALIKYFLSQGHRVTVLSLCCKGDSFWTDGYINEIRLLGADIQVIPYDQPLNSVKGFWKKIYDYFTVDELAKYYPTLSTETQLAVILHDLAPDAIVAVHTEPLAPLMRFFDIPCLGLMGDPTHLPIWFSRVAGFRWAEPLKSMKSLLYCAKIIPSLIKMDIQMLSHCSRRGVLAGHYAKWFRDRGISDCMYYPIPIADEVGPNWRIERDSAHNNRIFKIILLGALHGTATRLGLALFANQVYPLLCDLIGLNNFEVHIIGSGVWPVEVPNISGNSNVFIRGYVEDLKSEILSSDVLVVPTPINLGIRVRILTALSYGQCIIAHRANACGIPELSSGKNCLLGDSGIELAQLIAKVYAEPGLRRKLEMGSRQTYEQVFAEDVAAENVLKTIREMVVGKTEILNPVKQH